MQMPYLCPNEISETSSVDPKVLMVLETAVSRYSSEESMSECNQGSPLFDYLIRSQPETRHGTQYNSISRVSSSIGTGNVSDLFVL